MPATLLQQQSIGPTGKAPGTANEQLGLPGKELTAANGQMRSPRPAIPLPKSNACCLFWMAGSSLRPDEVQVLRGLHSEMAESVKLAGGRTLEDNATSGLVQLAPRDRTDAMSAEDAAVRLGQLLCRWAGQQRPAVRLRVAVHIGELQTFRLPASGRIAYLGPVVDTCKSLAMGAECVSAVHLSSQARDGLAVLGGERLRISRKGSSYYAEAGDAVEIQPAADKKQTLTELVAAEFSLRRTSNGAAPDAALTSVPDGSGSAVLSMLFRDFRQHLQDHGVDTDCFGKGDAKTLREFYNDVAIEQDSSLQVIGGQLRRFKDMIRIQLLTRGDDNRLRELRIDAQSRPDGSFRARNEKLAAVLRAHEGQRWKEALPQFFEEKFGLSKADQTACLSVDWDSYRYTEEKALSNTIPGIETTYRVHTVVVNVKDQARPQLSRMGLPGGQNFSTDKLTGEHRWKWAPVGGETEEDLLAKLHRSSIKLTPTAFSELSDEVLSSCQASLEVTEAGALQRRVSIIKVRLHADILAADHELLLDSKIQRGQCDGADKRRPLTMRMPRGQSWQKAVETLLHKRLGITPETQLSCIAVDPTTHSVKEETSVSRSYPGLSTLYEINEVTARVVMNEVDTATLHRIGLPDGQNFSFSRWEPAKGPGAGDMIITHWAWESCSEETSAIKVRRAPSLTDKHSEAWWAEVREKRRHLLVPELDGDMQGGHRPGAGSPWFYFSSATVLESMMKGKKVDMKRARRAAREICNPSYTCKDFYEDITAAFPELKLYLVGDTTSGRAGEDEYQRTLGAMFSFFWLMRLHLDGSQSFCFGLDEGWKARTKPFDDSSAAADEWDRRAAFHRDAEWASLEQLLVNAGLLEEATAGADDFSRKRSFLALASKKAKDTRRHNEDRTLGMLVLTAIHDIMKTVQLLPTVSRKHVSGSSFRGYKVGEVINDHDAALAYVLEFYPNVLPSFAALPKEQQQSVKFTQSKMEYNMGWLVQAEAPPGALFRKLRRVVASGQASRQDLAFYFTHWFTDLAGAEPFPQEGCEKFVLKFPKAVLNQFLLSFNIVQNIGLQGATETQVYEDYLAWRWDSHKPSLGPAPQGKGAIARMRLVTMAQGDSAAVLRAFDELPARDREVLSDELSNVDIWNQNWVREETEQKGPAILVYYAPALMQKAGKEDPRRALAVLAEVFRQARALWPLSEEARSWWVSVRVDQLKELPLAQVEKPKDGHAWAMAKLTSREGAVQLTPTSEVLKADWAASHAVLDLQPGGP